MRRRKGQGAAAGEIYIWPGQVSSKLYKRTGPFVNNGWV